jgi:integrase
VFRRPAGLPYAPLDPSNPGDTSAGGRIKKAFRGAVRRAGLADLHPHDMRHTWATWHYAQHRDPNALMALGGWKTPAMVFRYAHANVDQFQASIDALPTAPRFVAGPSSSFHRWLLWLHPHNKITSGMT